MDEEVLPEYGGCAMEYIVLCETENEIVAEAENGVKIRLLFSDCQNKKLENTILENLLCSYEKRMSASV